VVSIYHPRWFSSIKKNKTKQKAVSPRSSVVSLKREREKVEQDILFSRTALSENLVSESRLLLRERERERERG
jgi:hypothetical protein